MLCWLTSVHEREIDLATVMSPLVSTRLGYRRDFNLNLPLKIVWELQVVQNAVSNWYESQRSYHSSRATTSLTCSSVLIKTQFKVPDFNL